MKITRRFCGPPDSGNGGYTCGLVSAALGGPAEVTIRKPIPIERELNIVLQNADAVAKALLKADEELIAEGVALDWAIEDAPQLSFDEAVKAAEASPAFKDHPFPTCFTCGPQRGAGDGLRIFPGRINLPGRFADTPTRSNFFAAPWILDASLPAKNGAVADEIVWAALDCPTGFAGGFPYDGKLVTGRLGAHLFKPVHVGEKCILLSWSTGKAGRKRFATCVLLGESGEVKAQSRATWIMLQ